jgi:hypothetical protein
MSFVLILSIITSYGGVTTQRQTGFASYKDCATHAVAWAESQRSLHPDSELRWATNSPGQSFRNSSGSLAMPPQSAALRLW